MKSRRALILLAITLLSGCDTLKDQEFNKCMATVHADYKSDPTIRAHCRDAARGYIDSFARW